MGKCIREVAKCRVYMKVKRHIMRCYDCGDELIWGGDHDNEDIKDGIISNYNCSKCDCTVIIYWNNKGSDNES